MCAVNLFGVDTRGDRDKTAPKIWSFPSGLATDFLVGRHGLKMMVKGK